MNSNRSLRACARRAAALATVSALWLPLGLVGCSDDPAADVDESSGRLTVIFDYSPTLSDAGALLYLASNPMVDLVAVTLPGTGEADCEPGTRTTRSLLVLAGRPDVPVGCGRNSPLVGSRDWPDEWRTEVNRWGDDVLPAVEPAPIADAEELLADTLAGVTAPVTIIAVGPLTNLGAVLTAHPGLAGNIDRIVVMGGAIAVGGNVEAAPSAEWNFYIDPEAVRRVIDAGVSVTLIPLDATNGVPWTERLVRRLATLDSPAARTVLTLAKSRPSLAGFYLWDELAAIAAVHPELVTIESKSVTVDDDGAVAGDPTGVVVDVAVAADAAGATEEFMSTLNGGSLPVVVPLSSAERAYLVVMGGADSRFGAALSGAYALIDVDALDQRAAATAFVGAFFDAIDSLATELGGIVPPDDLTDAHARYVDSLSQLAAARGSLLDALDEADGADISELLDEAAQVALDGLLEESEAACQVIEDYSFLHDGPRPCSSAADQ
jgi:pyrimidine-specific ribonucleoside hydrolase